MGMSESYDIDQLIYQVGSSSLSFNQLLNYFIDLPQAGNLSRISDMHVKENGSVLESMMTLLLCQRNRGDR